MGPVVDDLLKLYDGVQFIYDTEILTVFGKVILCAGDTLGQQYLGGFKEGTLFYLYTNNRPKISKLRINQRILL